MARWLRIFFLFAVGALTLGSSVAQADAILPGFNLYATAPGTVIFVPGIGTVAVIGQPIGPANTSVIVRRTAGIDPFDPPNGTGTVPIELVALQLHSVQPVQVGSSFFDVFVTLTPNTISSGQMTVNHETTAGGTFDSFFDVFFEITFTDTQNPLASFIIHDQEHLEGSGLWFHSQPLFAPQDPNYPPGNWRPDILKLRRFSGSTLNLTPARTPEPGTLGLLGMGLGTLALMIRRKFSQ